MIAEAIDTALALGWALCVWIAVGAAVATVAVLAASAGVWWAGRILRRTVRAAWPRRGAWRGPGAPQPHSRDSRATGRAPKPADGHTAPHDYREAA